MSAPIKADPQPTQKVSELDSKQVELMREKREREREKERERCMT